MGQKSLLYIGPSVWNKLPSSMKRNINLNMFKYDVKKTLFTRIKDVAVSLSLLVILLSLLFLLTIIIVVHILILLSYCYCYSFH